MGRTKSTKDPNVSLDTRLVFETGGSLAITLPVEFVSKYHIQKGDRVAVIIVDGMLKIVAIQERLIHNV